MGYQAYVGLDEVADGVWSVYFGELLLGRLDERDYALYPNSTRQFG